MSVTTLAADGYLGLSYASSEPRARVLLRTGAVVDAGGDVELRATTETLLAIRTEVSSAGDVVGISTSFGRTHARSRAAVEAGATIGAYDLTLFAENIRSIVEHRASPAASAVAPPPASARCSRRASTSRSRRPSSPARRTTSGDIIVEARFA